MWSACRASSKSRDRGTFRGAYLVKRCCWASRGLGSGREGCVGDCCRGCIVIAEFCMESLHLLHADIIDGAEFQLIHGGGWVEVDVVGEGARFESEFIALKYHFLIEVWCAKGSLTETVNESL